MNGNGGSYAAPTISPPAKRATMSTPSPSTRSISASASTSTAPSSLRTRTYVRSGSTATAAFDGSVHGVVVQISSSSPACSGPAGETTGKRTYTDGSTTSLYAPGCPSSCEDSAVPQRGQ